MFRESQKIGPYILIRKLGQGSFGEVWLAENRAKFATTQVAIKLPLDEQVDHALIEQEAQLWAKASGHPNVLSIIEANEYNGQIVIVSEYSPDGSLKQYLEKNGGKLSIEQSVEITIGILKGLEFLHSRKIIHRDLKPDNVLLQGDIPCLADFGISRVIKSSLHTTNVAGTPYYMSPEAFKRERTIQTDIWSIGVMLYQMLKGKLPFLGDNIGEIFCSITEEEPEPLPNNVPFDLHRIVLKSLAKEPAERYQTANDMRKELNNFLVTYSQTSAPLPTQPSITQKFEESKPMHFEPTQKSSEQPNKTHLPISQLFISSPSPAKPKMNRLYIAIPAVILLFFAIIGGNYLLNGDKILSGNNISPTGTTIPSTVNALTNTVYNSANNSVNQQEETLISKTDGKWVFKNWENDSDRQGVLEITGGYGTFVSDSIYNVIQDVSVEFDGRGFIIQGYKPTFDGTNLSPNGFAPDQIYIRATENRFEVFTRDFNENKDWKPMRAITQSPSYSGGSSVSDLNGDWKFVFPGGTKCQMYLSNGSGTLTSRTVYKIRQNIKLIKSESNEIELEGSDPTFVEYSDAKAPKHIPNQFRFEIQNGNVSSIWAKKKDLSSKWQKLGIAK